MNLRELKIALKQLFRLMKVYHVVVVDDAYERRVTDVDCYPPIRVLIQSGAIELVNDVFHGRVNFSLPEAVWQKRLEELWGELEDPDPPTILSNLYGLIGQAEVAKDIVYASNLSRLLKTAVDVSELTPEQWSQEKERWLAEASAERRLLILFDWDMKGVDGAQLLKDAFNQFPRDAAILGLLSGKVTIDNERNLAQELADVPLSSCLPLAKERLLLNDGARFAEGLKLAALNNTVERILDDVIGVILRAVGRADRELRGMHPYDLVHVFKKAHVEGTWETESTFRLVDVFYRDSLREEAETEPQRTIFNNLVALLKNLAEVAAGELPGPQPSPRVREIRHRELYVPPGLNNRLHTPVKLGDIFDISGTHYIALAQPCDLMLRSGRRLPYVDLVEITDTRKEYHQDGPSLFGNLDYYTVDRHHYVAFKIFLTVPIELLDMTTFNEGGSCAISLEGDPPPGLSYRVAKNFRAVRRKMTDLLSRLRDADSHQDIASRERLRKTVLERYCVGGIPEPVLENGCLVFRGVRRVAHYREDMASLLLSSFSEVNARPARPGDFAAPAGD